MNESFIPAAFTPFHPDHSLNVQAVPHLAKLYKKQKCTTVFINGTTGEFPSLTLSERKLIAETWISTSPDASIWVHVGHTSQQEAIELAKHAQDIGAKAISVPRVTFFSHPHSK